MNRTIVSRGILLIRPACFRYCLWAVVVLASLSLPFVSALDRQQVYACWFDKEVHWIISDQERADFLKLSTDQQRNNFVVAFWARRDPTPGTLENEFKEEHYRRLAFANIHFASRRPGLETDRGHFYIVYGAPDDIQRISSLDYIKSRSANDGTTQPSLDEIWHYRHLRDREDVRVTFVDNCACGDYRLKTEPSEENLLP
jgi:GWxTD domain-containing protein